MNVSQAPLVLGGVPGGLGKARPDDLPPPDSEPEQGAPAPWWRFATRNLMGILLLLAVAVLVVTSPTFRSFGNIQNLFDQDVTLAIVASGMLCMMLTGGFDLSVGAAGATSGVLSAYVSLHAGVALGVLAGLGSGLVVGLINGVCVSFLDVNPLVTTLGSMTALYGLLDVWTGGSPVSGVASAWTSFGLGNTGPVPNPVFIAVGVVVLVFLLLRYTVHGQHIYAVGSNMAAAARAGVNVRAVLCSVYMIGSLMAAVGGLIDTSESGIGNPSDGTDWALTAIAAIVIGGTRLSGAVGGIRAVLVGTMLLTVMSNAFTLFGVSAFWVPVASGLVVIVAVAIDARSRRSRGSRVKERQI